MVCLFCHHDTTRVVNSRHHSAESRVWRRRRCETCQAVFTTYEAVTDTALPLVESDHTSQFSRARLMISLYHELPESPTRADTALALADTTTQMLLAALPDRLTPRVIACYAHRAITAYDRTAGMHYGLRHGLLTTL